jgi:hypothetical protein
VISAPVLPPFHRLADTHDGPISCPWPVSEHEQIELSRFRLMDLGHEMPVAVERRLDRRVPELRLDVLGMRALGDQQAGVGVAQVVKPDVPQASTPQEGREKTAAREATSRRS